VTTNEEALRELERRRALALAQGGPERAARHHASGRLTAHERLGLLLNEGPLREIGLLAIRVAGRWPRRPRPTPSSPASRRLRAGASPCWRSMRRSWATARAGPEREQTHIHYLAESKGTALVMLAGASGGRLRDLLDASFAELGGTFEGDDTFGFRHQRARVPRMTAVLGTSYGDPTFFAANSDVVIIAPGSAEGVPGPAVVLGATSLTITNEELAGYEVAGKARGLARCYAGSEPGALAISAVTCPTLPVVCLHDLPGVMIGRKAERQGQWRLAADRSTR
jgi:acetyl-CoA carboxylase carboxyltransferase component